VKIDPDRVIRDVARRIAEIRVARGLSQAALADIMGVSQGNVSRIELGEQNLTLRMMVRIANALDVELVDLLPRKR
jgi:UDP-N-acetylglucosamine 1-carboxyvinyltransferase